MRTYLECMPCFVRQALDSARRVTDSPAVQERLLREVLAAAAQMPFDQPPPVMGQLIHRRIRELTGIPDPYQAAKRQANEFALRLYPDLKRRIEEAKDSFGLAVMLAMAGNIVDLGAKTQLTDEEVRAAIHAALESTPDHAAVDDLRQAAASAREILYLADNAGEIVFDRLLIEQLPKGKVTLVVRGAPIINDATSADAEAVGLTGLVEVIDNGSNLPGTVLSACGDALRARFEAADLVISKGQGNYETLSECARANVFFLLKVKCAVIARDMGCDLGQMVIRRGVA